MQIYTVAQINSYIKGKFETDPRLGYVCVKGELSNVKYHHSGHIYFTLKDEKSSLACVMFSSYRAKLGFTLKEGQAVNCMGSISVYERDGKYQLYAENISLSGEGELYEKYEKLRKSLEEMGMFDKAYKQPIPKYVKTLGVVTAPTGAAVRDIINISRRRFPYIQIILFPAKVQGEGAAESVAAGIRALDEYGVDCIIAGRGGGSIEDLWAFNEEIVARAIFDCRTPLISAVGHETDTTIADWVADRRAATPSEAAELAVFDYAKFMERCDDAQRSLLNHMSRNIGSCRAALFGYQAKMQGLSPKSKLREDKMRLMHLSEKLPDLMEGHLLRAKERMKDLPGQLEGRIDKRLTDKKHLLQLYAGRLEGLSPLLKLSQGYSMTEGPEGRTLSSVERVHIGDEITVHLRDGHIKSTVSSVERISRNG